MLIDELLQDIKEGLSSSAWSAAILCARRGEVNPLGQLEGAWLFDVVMGRSLPFRVELNPKTGDFSCTCQMPQGTCAHVAAAALRLKHGPQSSLTAPGRPGLEGAPTQANSPPATGLRPGYRFTVGEKRWTVKAVLVDPHQPGVETDLATPYPLGAIMGPGDRLALELLAAGQAEERAGTLLQALALCTDVKVEGLAVKVMTEPVPELVVVEDHPSGMRVRLGVREKLVRPLPGKLNLVVVGDPPVLRPISRCRLPEDQLEYYRRAPILPPGEASRFLSNTLPRLQEKALVDIRTRLLQSARSAARPTARLKLELAEGGLDAVASVGYGEPHQAVVINGKLHLLAGASLVPVRSESLERRLASQVEALLGVPPGRRIQLRLAAAAQFAREKVPRFPGVVEGRELAERVRIYDQPLRPLWVEDPATGEPQLIFALQPGPLPSPGGAPRGQPPGNRHFSAPEVMSRGRGPASPSAPTGPSPQEPVRGRASLKDVLEAWEEGRHLLPLLDGGYAPPPREWLDHYGPLVQAMIEARETKDKPWRVPVMAVLMEAAEAAPNVVRLRQAFLESQHVKPLAPPAGLKANLRVYQQEGLSWMKHQEKQGVGVILADDMGLGKTLQALALVLTDAPEDAPSLVVAPTSVLDNWCQEAARFAPELPVLRYHGPDRALELPTGRGLVITSYALLRLDLEVLEKVTWQRVILDEAQAIKNPDSQSAQAARRLSARHRVALTGTPLENRLLELWSLLEFLNRGMLGSRSQFEDRYRQWAEAGDPAMVRRLRARVRPFLLRRLKQDVEKELPPRTDRVVRATLSLAEKTIYDALRASSAEEVQKILKQQGLKKGGFQILELILRLRQACCHAALVPGSGFDPAGTSAKLHVLLKELEELKAEGHKALVFSQWTSLLDLLEPHLRAAGLGFLRLDGSTRDRGTLVERFQARDGPPIFLLSLKAGGTGLNLTAADYVYLMDPWWNPAVEAQATDRAHRIGQTRPVVATRIIAADTIEARMLDIQARKRKVANAALGGEEAFFSSLSEDDLESLLA